MNCVFPYEKLPPAKKPSIWTNSWKQWVSLDTLKFSIQGAIFISLLIFYAITVTVTSTKWYHYDQARKQQDRAEFKYNIVKLNNLTLQSELRNQINFNTPLKNNSIHYLNVKDA